MERLREGIGEILASPYFWAASTFVFCLFVAWIGNRFILKYLERAAETTDTEFDDELLEIVDTPLVWSVRLLGVYLAVSIVSLPEAVNFVAVGVLVTLIIFVWTRVAFQIATRGTLYAKERFSWLGEQTAPLLMNIAKVVVLAMAAYFFFLAWDINLTAWLASAGIAGIAVGFAAKDMLSNLFGGVFVLIDTPYREGDFIVLDTGDRGKVDKIGLRSTRLITPDRMQITIPNSTIATAQIVNESSGPDQNEKERRISTEVGIEYGADIDEVTRLLESAVETVRSINSDVEPEVRLIGFGEESLLVRVACQLEDPQYEERCLDELNRAMYGALEDRELLGPPV